MAAERVVTAAAARAVTVAAAAQHLADQAAGAARAELAEEAAEEAAAEVQHPEAVLAAAEEAPARAGSDPEAAIRVAVSTREAAQVRARVGALGGPTFGPETGLSLGHAVQEGRGGEVSLRPRSAPWAG